MRARDQKRALAPGAGGGCGGREELEAFPPQGFTACTKDKDGQVQGPLRAREKPCWMIPHSLLARTSHAQSQPHTSTSKPSPEAQSAGAYRPRSIAGGSSGLPWAPGPTAPEVPAGFSGHFLLCSTGCCHGDWAQVSRGCRAMPGVRKLLKINGLLHRSLFFFLILLLNH